MGAIKDAPRSGPTIQKKERFHEPGFFIIDKQKVSITEHFTHDAEI